jgi:DNA-binding beta-propeller fold protein YncE
MLLSPDQTQLTIAAWHNSRIRTIDVATGTIVETCGAGRRAYFGDEGPALTATLDLPAAVVLDPDGDLVVLDQANQVIRAIDADGVIHRIAGQCLVGDESLGGAPVACPGGSGKLAFGDPATACPLACNGGFATTDDPLTMRMRQNGGQDAAPGGRLVYDDEGRLYFADTSNQLVRRIDFETGLVETIAGREPVDGIPQVGSEGDGGPATDATLSSPVDLALGDDGTLYLTDVDNHCVRAVDPSGMIRTVVGRCGERGFAGVGGDPLEALLMRPFGLELVGEQLFVSDSGNHRIRVVNL